MPTTSASAPPTEPAELVRVSGSRWAIEECFQTTKNETGLDHYQVRGYPAWYRHITLSMAAAGFLTILRRGAQKRESETGVKELIPLTINEIQRLFNRVACRVRHALVHVWHWVERRRASQARASASHYKHRHHKLSLQYWGRGVCAAGHARSTSRVTSPQLTGIRFEETSSGISPRCV